MINVNEVGNCHHLLVTGDTVADSSEARRCEMKRANIVSISSSGLLFLLGSSSSPRADEATILKYKDTKLRIDTRSWRRKVERVVPRPETETQSVQRLS